MQSNILHYGFDHSECVWTCQNEMSSCVWVSCGPTEKCDVMVFSRHITAKAVRMNPFEAVIGMNRLKLILCVTARVGLSVGLTNDIEYTRGRGTGISESTETLSVLRDFLVVIHVFTGTRLPEGT